MYRLLTTAFGKADRLLARLVNRLRLVRLRLLGARIGNGVRVYGRFVVAGDARNLSIGDGSTINEGVLFDLRERIAIGRQVRLSSNVRLHTSRLDSEKRGGLHMGSPIAVGDHVWLASGVVVCGGVTIGEGSIIGANAVVISDIATDSFAAGLPAKLVKTLPK